MEWLSMLGIFIALFVYIWYAYKGYNVLFLSIVCTIIVYLFDLSDPIAGLAGTYMAGFSGFAKSWFLVYLFSAVFARMMGECGAARSIAVKIVRFCKRWPRQQKYLAILCIPLINSVLTYGGVSALVVVFIMVGIAKDIFEELDIPWHFYGVAALGSATFALGMLPGAPDVINLTPLTYLGTTPMAAPMLGIIATLIQILLSCLYVKHALNRSELAGEGFMPTGRKISEDIQLRNGEVKAAESGLLISLTPCLVLLFVMNGLKQSPVTALLLANLVCFGLFYKKLQLSRVLTLGIPLGVNTSAIICGTIAFGKIITETKAYSLIIGGLDQLSFLSPAFQIFVCVNIVAALTSSGTSAVAITMDQFASRFLAMEIPADAIHRLSTATALGLNTLPHSAGIVNAAAASRLTHKEIYKHYFWITVAFPFIASFVMAVLITAGFVA